jgi:hypothetical protein
VQTLAPATVAPTTDPYADRAPPQLAREPDGLERVGNGDLPLTEADRWRAGRSCPAATATSRSVGGRLGGRVLAPAPGGQAAVADDGRDRPDRLLPDPPHAAHLRAALDRLSASQAVVAVVLDPAALPVLLSCDDFSADIAAHRLWVAAGGTGRSRSDRCSAARGAADAEPVRPAEPAGREPARPGHRRGPAGARRRDGRPGGAGPATTAGWQPPSGTAGCASSSAAGSGCWDDAGLALSRRRAEAGAAVEPAVRRVRCVDADEPLTASTLAMLRAAASAGRC